MSDLISCRFGRGRQVAQLLDGTQIISGEARWVPFICRLPVQPEGQSKELTRLWRGETDEAPYRTIEQILSQRPSSPETLAAYTEASRRLQEDQRLTQLYVEALWNLIRTTPDEDIKALYTNIPESLGNDSQRNLDLEVHLMRRSKGHIFCLLHRSKKDSTNVQMWLYSMRLLNLLGAL